MGGVKNEGQEYRGTFPPIERLKRRLSPSWDEKDLGRAPYLPGFDVVGGRLLSRESSVCKRDPRHEDRLVVESRGRMNREEAGTVTEMTGRLGP